MKISGLNWSVSKPRRYEFHRRTSLIDSDVVEFKLPELVRVQAIEGSGESGGDGSKNLVNAMANLLMDIALNRNIETLGVDITESPDLIQPTLQAVAIDYDQPSVVSLTFSETIDVAPAELINKSLINIVNYQGQEVSAGAVSLVAANQSMVQGLVVNFTLTEAQRVQAMLFSGVAGGDSGTAKIDVCEAFRDMGENHINNHLGDDETPDTTNPFLKAQH